MMVVIALYIGMYVLFSISADSIEALIVTLGFGVGVGLSFTYISSIFAVTYYFERRRGLAIGLAVTGSGIGAIVSPLAIEMLLDVFLWRGSLLILSGLSLNIIVAGSLFFPLLESKTDSVALSDAKSSEEALIDKPPKSKWFTECELLKHSILDISLYKNWKFLVFSLSSLLCYMWIGAPYVYLGDKVITMGFDLHQAVWLFSIIGISRTCGQLLLGWSADFKSVNEVLLYSICIFACGLATALLPLCITYDHFRIYASVFGFFVSATYSVQMLCVVQICGIEKASNAFGVLQLIQGLATLLGTPIPGWSSHENIACLQMSS